MTEENKKATEEKLFKSLEEIKEEMEADGQYKELKEKLTEENYHQVFEDVSLFKMVFAQVSDIYQETIFNQNNEFFQKAVTTYNDIFMKNFDKQFLLETTADDHIAPIPEMEHIVTWNEEIHKEILYEIFDKNYVDTVINHSFDSISEAIFETIDEDEREESEDENGN